MKCESQRLTDGQLISGVGEVGAETIPQCHHLGPFIHPLSSSPSVDHASTVGKIHKLLTAKLHELEAPRLTK